jgi:hypothetical protein
MPCSSFGFFLGDRHSLIEAQSEHFGGGSTVNDIGGLV